MRRLIGAMVLAATALTGPAAATPPRKAPARPAPPAPRLCPHFVLDLETGRMNGVSPAATKAQVHRAFPCATGDTAEAVTANYGGGVFYTQHDFYFYTWRRFLDVRSGFTGTMRPALLGQTKAQITYRYNRLTCDQGTGGQTRPRWACGSTGQPAYPDTDFIAMKWGCLVVNYRDDRVDSLWLFPELQRDPLLAEGCTNLMEPT